MEALFEKIKTSEEKDKLMEEIDILLNSLFQNKGEAFSILLKTGVRAWLSEYIRAELAKDEANPFEYLKKIKEELNSFKALKLTLAFEPTESNIEKFSYAVKKYLGEKVVIEFSYNPTLIAGCTLTYEGKYRDFSMKSFFNSEFAKIKQDLFIQMAH
ncbi:hypothetical protein A2962_03575 [Candidatus Woesebacteria bacterium RIFCSPLOWO2_01_FULL_39_61]|uniref:Uncharacterized protein n=1 Tax=Candidatus Woesebacteria bacterium RIFCSPHIGHO2_02_FULL_39_13 TaxID=1802505 RepID=A0A1F7Z3T7_9BACT|nr:MAG: hypothetical protein A2692_00705 [Candidatus Woesebacteria bacterium RIFCSPHIGHO2_01_FULL_39_95]OGM34131.1 MAG: hypothetical protein A3D01_00160 [Candidatus Woesebacteria bacterium RIFCSPHIGHO2_02_FULL_39_13]OGM38730.1 MAG: hypothetical protein A3E13_03895 [Candidatus Woesebacteria bacterium RIFCSPHIGHO2_12_FULL_40_20]OGM67591.1 MAG: hypothetical protein A2962_03575 [Candidatus Woesebacteria bacterium RIFCSPLOWO2_01_FULL_39_61]